MTNEEYQLFLPQICRLCGMKKSSGINLEEPADRADKIMKTLLMLPKRVINITSSDKLSKFVCIDCEVILLHFSEFCEMIRKVQKNLKSQQKSSMDMDKINENKTAKNTDCHTNGSSPDGLPVVISVGRDNHIQCQVCQSCLLNDQLMTLHMLTHGLGSVLCLCKHCGHQDDIGNFLHHDNSAVKCPQCMFMSIGVVTTTNQTSKAYDGTHVCEVCNMRFRTKYRYNRHKLIHTGSKPFLCETCGMKFNQKASLKLHMLKHTKANPHSCQWCGQSFRFKVSLQSHVLSIHGSTSSGTKVCDQCNKQFATVYKLHRHYRVHTGDRPYACPTCNKCFSHTGNLKNHMKKHKSDNSDSFSETFSADQLLESDQILDTILDSCPQGKEFMELQQGEPNYGLGSDGNVNKHNSPDLFTDFNPQDMLFGSAPLMTSANHNSTENVIGF